MDSSFKMAMEWAQQTIETKESLSHPVEVDSLYSIAYQLYQRKEYLEALPFFKILVQAEPKNGKFWKALGSCLQMLKEYESALNCYTTAQILNGQQEDLLLYVHAADCYFALQEIEKGLKTLNKACQQAKKNKNDVIQQHVQFMRELWA